jgi:hypothetical protein
MSVPEESAESSSSMNAEDSQDAFKEAKMKLEKAYQEAAAEAMAQVEKATQDALKKLQNSA